jgi:AraC-like DNA-binding protein
MTQISPIAPSFKIKCQTYDQLCYRLTKDFLFFERNHLWEENSIQVDVFSEFWSVALTNTVEQQLVVKRGSDDFDLLGKHFIFIPPYSIIEWRIAKGLFKWQGYISKKQLPPDMPNEPVAFPWTGKYFTSEIQLFEFVRSSGFGKPINKKDTASRVATGIKKWIDANFQSELNLSLFAKNMGVSQAYLTKEFKQCFGISPQTYINKIRTFEGMSLLILNEANVSGASARIGYADSSSFRHHFIEEFKGRPSNFYN